MKNEFRKIVKDTLAEYSYDNDAQVINMTSEYSQDLLAEAIEERIKSKFHIFRINKILTGDSPSE
ncbi:hypothetical protein CMI37_10640 [Candidatus Pacearchaeota archaeon]|jgi:hypothetical protein|nr:hypothetical protein [Candidatus Pacearchaeota archaeon]|tara:strand:- start:830 stop:1024 length:195 start_codon:yes stop_codon:yes gene_type:complete